MQWFHYIEAHHFLKYDFDSEPENADFIYIPYLKRDTGKKRYNAIML